MRRNVLFAGCAPEVAASPNGMILAVGERARAAAGRAAQVVRLSGLALPGLIDAHLHLHLLALERLSVDLGGARSLEAALARVQRWSRSLPKGAWVAGRGWYNDDWADPRFPDRRSIDGVTGGRPALLTRKDGHSAWANSAALTAAGIGQRTPDPPGGVIDREPGGEATGILRETAIELVRKHMPEPGPELLDRGLENTLRSLATLGLTSVHSMDPPPAFASLQRLRFAGRLPIRVVWNLPLSELNAARSLGVAAGLGDDMLRIWGVKAFLDGSLGNRTAEMLDGSGTPRLGQSELMEMLRGCGEAGLNVCLHAIGDGAVRRALDAIEAAGRPHALWRPRIEHAQAVHPSDQPRFGRLGVVASMQPVHALADRDLADRDWGQRVRYAYAWRALEAAGAVLAFGSDAPVEIADPCSGSR